MTAAPVQAVITGATGYVGGELLRLIAAHPQMELLGALSGSQHGDPIASVFAHLGSAYPVERFCSRDDLPGLLSSHQRLALFSAAPHGASAGIVAEILQLAATADVDVHAVDASADFRYADIGGFESVYGCKHQAPGLAEQFFCALPEHLGATPAPHAGHPGCFATSMLLGIVPLLSNGFVNDRLFVSAVTGSTGSGRSPQAGTHHPVRHSNLYAYKPLAHRHVPEVRALTAAATGITPEISFVPHSGPFARGIHATCQAPLAVSATGDDVRQALRAYYADAAFVRVVDGTPRLKDVVASNYAHLGVAVHDDTVVVMCVIDNLLKGAAGGAMQWMNRLWELPESAGLTAAAPAWT